MELKHNIITILKILLFVVFIICFYFHVVGVGVENKQVKNVNYKYHKLKVVFGGKGL